MRCSSLLAPDQGIGAPDAGQLGQVAPELGQQRGLAFAALAAPRARAMPPAPPRPPRRLVLGEAGGLAAHDIGVDAQLAQHPPGQAIPLGQDAQEQVLGADVLRAEALGL